MTSAFRFIFWAQDYDETVHFYQEKMEFPVVSQWDRSPTQRGTMVKVGTGELEILTISPGKEVIDPKGFEISIQADGDVDTYYEFVKGKGIPIHGEIADKPWGQRTFSVKDPNGIKLIFFSDLS